MGNPNVKYIFLNGSIIPFMEAKIHVLNTAMKYSASIYDAWRGYWNEGKKELFLFRLEDHLIRLFQSAKIARMNLPYTKKELIDYTKALLRRNELREDIHCRLIAFVDEVDGRILSTSPVSVTIATIPMGRYFNKTMTGLNCCVSSWTRISDNALPPRLKCPANYNNSRLAGIQAKIDGYDAVVLLDGNGKVTEGEGYNLFMIRNGVIVTPPVTYSILEGVTRSTLLRLFEDHLKVRVVERAIDRTELYIAEEIFVCGSGAEVAPILSVDRHSVGNGAIGAITRKIQETYFELVRGKLSGYEDWLLPTYGEK